MSKNDVAWNALFEKRKILDDIAKTGIHRITSSAINQYREARLMTKFDHRVNLPEIFAKHELAILPDSRSSYVIGRFECYASIDVDYREAPIERGFPEWMQSLTPDNLYSESSALLCAHHAGLIADILEEDVFFTVFGRMSTGTFDFSIQATSSSGVLQHRLNVDRAQCEVDGGFESAESFALLEVKNEEVQDFHIRQLYFPYRLWNGKLAKRVTPIFMTYSNEVFTFSAYKFENPEDYNSLRLIRRKRYQIVPNDIEIGDIRRIISETRTQPEPDDIPFPQADSMERIIDLLTQLHLAGGSLDQEEITTNYAFDRRQTQYYSNAARYLKLLDRAQNAERGVYYTLTELGADLMKKAPKARNKTLIELILLHTVFREAVAHYLSYAVAPTVNEVVSMIDKAQLSISGTTRGRRAQTVLGWVRWIMQLTADS